MFTFYSCSSRSSLENLRHNVVASRIMVPSPPKKRYQHTFLGICEYITLYDKRDLAYVIGDLETEGDFPELSGGPNVIIRVL